MTGERAPGQGGSNGDDVAQGRVARDPTYDPETQAAERSYGLTVEGDLLRLSLVGLARDVDLSSLLAGPTVNADASRTVAFFEVRNASDRVLTWEGRRHATFVGDDGFMYEGSSIVTPHDDRLPDRWCGTGADVEPGRALDAVVIAEDLPDGVAARQVIYTQRVRGAEGTVTDTERYLFEIPPAVGRRLDHLPFDCE